MLLSECCSSAYWSVHLWHHHCPADAPGVTQIVYSFGPDGDPDDGVQYMRVLDRRYSKVELAGFMVIAVCQHVSPVLVVET